MRQVSVKGLELVKVSEGLHKIVRYQPIVTIAAYVCPAGYYTIGYGHLCKKDQPVIDEARAEEFLVEDLAKAENGVCAAVPTWSILRDGQYAALVDFVFNLGSGNFRASTLRRKINDGDWTDVPYQFSRWVYGGGKALPGLIARRAAEVQLWLEK